MQQRRWLRRISSWRLIITVDINKLIKIQGSNIYFRHWIQQLVRLETTTSSQRSLPEQCYHFHRNKFWEVVSLERHASSTHNPRQLEYCTLWGAEGDDVNSQIHCGHSWLAACSLYLVVALLMDKQTTVLDQREGGRDRVWVGDREGGREEGRKGGR